MSQIPEEIRSDERYRKVQENLRRLRENGARFQHVSNDIQALMGRLNAIVESRIDAVEKLENEAERRDVRAA